MFGGLDCVAGEFAQCCAARRQGGMFVAAAGKVSSCAVDDMHPNSWITIEFN
jgi:hypothetical protein